MLGQLVFHVFATVGMIGEKLAGERCTLTTGSEGIEMMARHEESAGKLSLNS